MGSARNQSLNRPHMDEAHVRGRRAGVEGTYGEKGGILRHKKDVAEATVVSKREGHDSGGEDGLPVAAHSMYRKAVMNKGDSIGDKALTER